ncbi:hypothetical protein SAMN04488104_100881 [Algoriphagus faecimaris]|uniref:Uncharacterized protein n=1 Tax=Algoriphagus faecimaris TaxID=686796 RepID=A0A1G6Q6V0_9BACT|nr:DUF6090 family protein [Algoriphagus faecimaris]SDC88202.1 hypothetical protein SAMN04488104_100881 [Algoriphagus faecimaris]
MISLFRKIRQKLLKQNKMGSDLKYAIGEIFLVVIGILIALQINNWNENRKTETKRQIYYRQLLVDLKNDQDYCKNRISDFEAFLKKYADYEKEFQEGALNLEKSLENISELQIGGINLFFKTNTIKTLISTGDISLFPQNINNGLTTYLDVQNELISGNNTNATTMVDMIGQITMLGTPFLRKRFDSQAELSKELNIQDNIPKIFLQLEAYHSWKANTIKTSIKNLNDLIINADSTITIINNELKK